MGQTTKVSAIVRQIRDGILTSAQEVTSKLNDIPVIDINYRQLQTIIKVYRLENYTDTKLAGKGITAQVLRRELVKAIENHIKDQKDMEDILIKYVLKKFGLKGGRFIILDKDINELVEVAGLDKGNIPADFYNSVRDRWASMVKNM